VEPKPVGIDPAIASAQHEHRLTVALEHERLDDLPDLDVQRRDRERGGPCRVAQGRDLDLEPAPAQAFGEASGGRVHGLTLPPTPDRHPRESP
jgi:hypothetical protein